MLVPIPFGLYLLFVGAGSTFERALFINSIASVVLVIAVASSVVLRYYLLRPYLAYAGRGDQHLPPGVDVREIKSLLLRLPRIEALAVGLRWIFGTIVSYLAVQGLTGIEIRELVTTFIVLPIVVPVTMVGYFFMTENFFASALESPALAAARVSPSRIRNTGFTLRFVGTPTSLVILPLGVFGFLLVLITQGYARPEGIGYHLAALTALFILAIAIVSYSAAKAFERSVTHLKTASRAMARGEFRNAVPQLQADEIGDVSRYFQRISRAVSAAIAAIHQETNDLVADSRQLAANGAALNRSTLEQASSTEEISAALEQLAAAGDTLAAGAARQSAEARTADAEVQALHEKLQAIHQLSESLARSSEDTYEQALGGTAHVEASVRSMAQISAGTNRMAEAMKLINEVADRVNLLSLNASIEAARAGEYGRGFAVVASEISRLADQTQQHGNTILELVTEAVERVEEGTAAMRETSRIFQGIHRSVGENRRLTVSVSEQVQAQFVTSASLRQSIARVQEMSTETSTSLAEQNRTHKELTEGLQRISEATATISESVDVVAALARNLTQRADSLAERAAFFEVAAANQNESDRA